ncbi:sensor domain-containing protein [Paraburkholderia acidipaludis]|uniref:sensor domain-containing protein n=1 Tax=Paraburkholderia acidipaludis TaxID=660537 RepID=UPI0006931DFC|nr:bifunctional diguanylate cyclase/phosphodiesterase [Paraburkholderia acidipaludis]
MSIALSGRLRTRLVTGLAVAAILAAIGLNTTLALRQTQEQNHTLGQQQSVAVLKRNLDALQDALLDEHEQLYTVVGMRPFFRRPASAYIYPLPALLDYASAAQQSCGGEPRCIALLDELKDMIRHLGKLSNELAMRALLKPGSVTIGAPKLGELDARFFQTMQKIGEVRMAEDEHLDTSVSKASHDAEVVSDLLLGSGLAAALMLLALLYRNGRITKSLRVALRTADSNREKYQRLFVRNPLPIWIVDDESGRIVAVNDMAVEAMGYRADEMLRMTLDDIRTGETPLHGATVAQARALQDGVAGVWSHRTKQGEMLSMAVFHLHTELDGRRATLCVMEDMTKELAAQAELFRSMQMLEYVLDNIPTGIAWKDSSHRYAGGNEIYAKDAGLVSRKELVGLTDDQLRWGDDPAAVRAEDIRIMAGELVKKRVEREAIAVDGSTVWIAETKLPLIDPSGTGVGVLTAYENITATRESQLALRLQGRALDASISGIVIAQAKPGAHPVRYVNRAFEKLTGLRFEEVVGKDFGTLFAAHDTPEGAAVEMANHVANSWAEVQAALQSDADANLTLQCRHRDGDLYWINMLVAPVPAPNGKVTHHVAIMSDVTAVIRYQAELERQAQYDTLTGLPNRKQLDDKLAAALQRAARSGDTVAVIFLDLDHFKEVNDSLGHRIGDALLGQIARRLERMIGSRGTVARYGGDEFMVVTEGIARNEVAALLDELLVVMTEPVRISAHELFIEASMGISVFPTDGADADTLIRNADAAMYLAKHNGRNQYQFYRPELSEAAASRLRVSTRLRRAFKNGELNVMYQPQFDMASGGIVGAEALLRWTDAELGEVSPAVFIPLAEDTGLIRAIGEWVLREACSEGARWNAMPGSRIRVSVNVSPLQLEHSDLVDQVSRALHDSGLAPELLELEVTEGALIRHPEHTAKTLASLRDLGVRIAIDDFGTGYSSLSYLKRFRVDRLKIDRAFVKEIGQDPEMEAITLAVIAVAKAFNFELIAEGVETRRHRDFLLENGCTQAQGFLYSRAISGHSIARFLSDEPAASAEPGLVD